MAAHSSVQYVEPNSYDDISTFTESITVDGKPLNKIIDPEDYCIGLSITTSLCNRGVQVSSDDTAVTLNCEMNKTGSKVSFMSGRLVKADNINGGKVPYLTTDYADMYVTDLKDYGTTQMIGIKSVNIDFENAVLPVITIQFTDVRGMSLFTPKEIRGSSPLTSFFLHQTSLGLLADVCQNTTVHIQHVSVDCVGSMRS